MNLRRLGGWLAGRLGRGSDGENLGRRGERLAAKWLRKQGYRILERNFRVGDDEADLVALDPDGRTIVIIEVKTRRDDSPLPEEGVNSVKQFRQARLAARLQRSAGDSQRAFRFDAIAVIWPAGGDPVIRHHPGAFHAPW